MSKLHPVGKKPAPMLNPETVRVLRQLLDDELDALADVLPYLYFKFAEVHAANDGKLDTEFIENYLPILMFEVAKTCHWVTTYHMSPTLSDRAIQDPVSKGWKDPEDGSIGKWLVNKTFETEFFRLLEPAMETLRRIAAAHQAVESGVNDIRWKEPTPREIIDRFLKKRRWTKATLIRRMSGEDTGKGDEVDETDKQMLKRLYATPKRGVRIGKDVRTVQRIGRLINVMAAELPEEFGSLAVADLCWTPE